MIQKLYLISTILLKNISLFNNMQTDLKMNVLIVFIVNLKKIILKIFIWLISLYYGLKKFLVTK